MNNDSNKIFISLIIINPNIHFQCEQCEAPYGTNSTIVDSHPIVLEVPNVNFVKPFSHQGTQANAEAEQKITEPWCRSRFL